MATPIAHMAATAEGGFVRVIYRYADNTTKTVLTDPVTKQTVVESVGVAELDAHGSPTPTWWNG